MPVETRPEVCNASTSTNPADTTVESVSTSVLVAALERSRDRMAALDEKDIITPNVDILVASGTVVNAARRIEPLRDRIRDHLPKFDLVILDRAADSARAARYAHQIYLGAIAPPKDLAAMQDRAVVVRDTLYSDIGALAQWGLVNGNRLKEFKQKVGYRATANDIGGLTAILREGWARFAGRTGSTLAYLDEADNLSDRIVEAFDERENSPAAIARAATDRARAFTLMANDYDQLRRAVIYLQWDAGDAEKLAPSFYAGRGTGGGHKKPDAPVDGTTATTEPVASTPTSETHTAAAGAAAPNAPLAAPAEIAPGSGLSSSTAIGMPGSNPFGG